jgi:hypothetical protein
VVVVVVVVVVLRITAHGVTVTDSDGVILDTLDTRRDAIKIRYIFNTNTILFIL